MTAMRFGGHGRRWERIPAVGARLANQRDLIRPVVLRALGKQTAVEAQVLRSQQSHLESAESETLLVSKTVRRLLKSQSCLGGALLRGNNSNRNRKTATRVRKPTKRFACVR